MDSFLFFQWWPMTARHTSAVSSMTEQGDAFRYSLCDESKCTSRGRSIQKPSWMNEWINRTARWWCCAAGLYRFDWIRLDSFVITDESQDNEQTHALCAAVYYIQRSSVPVESTRLDSTRVWNHRETNCVRKFYKFGILVTQHYYLRVRTHVCCLAADI